ncbi:unnamed protein product [Phytophthora fragariaefolia]|uniref:Unnamed protein product n=1 Tax=Phytophthora fragariaefolia TaxID=1490495 RepID=A0A9W6Y0V8_9STRA|nr:unnamed protein product [Phytophthora fragariaefolia]
MFRIRRELASYGYDMDNLNLKPMLLEACTILNSCVEQPRHDPSGESGIVPLLGEESAAGMADVNAGGADLVELVRYGSSGWSFDTGSNVPLTEDNVLLVYLKAIDSQSIGAKVASVAATSLM